MRRFALLSLLALTTMTAHSFGQESVVQLPDYTSFTPVMLNDLGQRIQMSDREQRRLSEALRASDKENVILRDELAAARSAANANSRTARELRIVLEQSGAPANAMTLVELLLSPSEQQKPSGKTETPGGAEVKSREYDVYSSFIASQPNATRLYQPLVLRVALEPASERPAAQLAFGDAQLYYATRITVIGDTLPFVHPSRHFEIEPLAIDKSATNFSWRITPTPGQFRGRKTKSWERMVYLSVAGSISAPLKYNITISRGHWWQRWFDRAILFFRGNAYATLVGVLSAIFTMIVNLDKLRSIFKRAPKAADASRAVELNASGAT